MGKLYCLNVGCADASIIKTSNATFLVDCHNIGNYSDLLPKNKDLFGVFITHQHEDHYSGLAYLKDKGYTINNLIYSPYQRRREDQSVTIDEWNEFKGYLDHFQKKGAKLYAPYRQNSFNDPWWTTNGVSFEIIGPAKSIATSDTRELHDACLVIRALMGNRRCLFTGDASDTNLKWIADNTKSYCDDILHASHHGSINGANIDFIKKSNASYTVVSTKSGVHKNIPHPRAMQRYRNYTKEAVYRTDIDGSWEWEF